MEITCTIDENEILQAVADSSDPLQFIVDLDEFIADEGFTLDVMSRLAETMAKEYEATERHYTNQLMEVSFGEERASSPWSPKPSDLEQVTRQRETMSKVVALLKDLS